MTAGQKMNGENGLQNALFPFEYMYVTQGEHDDGLRYNMDFRGQNASGRVYKCPMYAPCDLRVVFKGASAETNPTVCWQSINQVNFVDGSVDYLCISVSHDDNWNSYNIGDTVSQGEVFSHTGTTGKVTGDHTHMVVGKGAYEGYYTPSGASGNTLRNQYHMYNALGVNDTVLVVTGGYNWQEFIPYVPPEPPTPPQKKKDIMPLSLCNALKWSV